MKRWFCMGCQKVVKLDKHGRCEICESEAVDLLFTEEQVNSPVSVVNNDSESSSVAS
jgi:rRNA maturation endonuclease Nob1